MPACLSSILLAAISLDGVSGGTMYAQSRFDSNNVHVGDPMVLTVDFVGRADFTNLHPPELSREVDRKTWRVDDASAKTETFRDAKSLKYRVRPLKEGVIEFPAITFTYKSSESEETLSVSTAAIPVHAKPGSQVALAELENVRMNLPQPDGIVIDLSSSPWGSAKELGEDGLFAWNKACSAPSAAAFAAFDIPEARLNEAACELMDGNWAKAAHIYSVLEWRIGQTPTIERGMVAAAALKSGNPNAELPMWRQTLRPVLRMAWKGRTLSVVAAVALLALLVFALRMAARLLACAAVALVLAAPGARAADPFEEMDKLHQQIEQRMRQHMQEMSKMTMGFGGGGGMSLMINGHQSQEPNITAAIRPETTDLRVGEQFNLVLSLEMPKGCTVSNVSFEPSPERASAGLVAAGTPTNMTDGRSSNPSNVVRRISVPVRYDAPFKGRVFYNVKGVYEMNVRNDMGGGRVFSSMFQSNFSVATTPIWMDVKPLPGVDQPDDFSGAVGTSFRLSESADMYLVETNDIVTVTAKLSFTGYVPPEAFPGAVEHSTSEVVFSRYFVADGRARTDPITFCYYDVNEKKYKRIATRGMAINYGARAPESAEQATIVVNAAGGDGPAGLLKLRFSPRESAPVVASVAYSASAKPAVTEEKGGWARIDDGSHAGWVKKEELQ